MPNRDRFPNLIGASPALALLLILAPCVAAHGEERPTTVVTDEKADATPSGQDIYLRHCAICHGLDGRGHGPLTEAMKIAPADLTRIKARHEGAFPDAKVADVVRNGGGVLGHGSTAMLPWGLYFSERGNPALGKARIKALVAYIKSIQED